MQQIIEQLASESGISIDDSNNIFIAISNRIVNKIPLLQQVIEDVFENAEAEKLKVHISKLIINLEEQQRKEAFEQWMPPQQYVTRHQEQSKELF